MRFTRTAASIASSAMAATGLFLTAVPAHASAEVKEGVTFDYSLDSDGGGHILASYKDLPIARGDWSADPVPPENGDTLCVEDDRADGYYAKTKSTIGRTVNTKGHNAVYRKCAGGNIKENYSFTIQLCVVNSGGEICSRSLKVHG